MARNTASSPRPSVSPAISIITRRRDWTRATAGSSGGSSASRERAAAMAETDDPDEDGEIRAVVVDPSAAGKRLDAFLASSFPDISRNRLKNLILAGAVTIDGDPADEPRLPVPAGARILVGIPPAEPAEPEPENIPLDIVFEDRDIIVIDKPAGLVVHPAAGHGSGTLVNALLAHAGDSLSGVGGVKRPGIVHRLDKDTSGLLVIAKNDLAHQSLAAQFADHGRTGALERGYKALVWGAPFPPTGTSDAPLARSTRNRQLIAISRTGGREAITHYRLEAAYGDPNKPIAARLDLRLETGRTHQIRVHLTSIGHPVIGDPDYGTGFATKLAKLPEPAKSLAAQLKRQALHAFLLVIEHPRTGRVIRFERPFPPDLAAFDEALSKV
ncbi:MAG: RluA family pseudouridine synthase [Bauldia sp.]|nr:RluA family pseudouridine synthase [Bauldia sp.]